MLDNTIYNAHTMAVDTLWSGVPLLTFGYGVDMGGRVGYSILTTLGLDEYLVAKSDKDFVKRAVHLATNKEAYANIHARLVETTRKESLNPFWDTKLYVKNLERGFKAAWEIFQDGEAPRNIDLSVEPPARTAAEFIINTCKKF